MSNSPLVSYTKLSPNCNKPRHHAIDTITIHCMAGDLSVESCGAMFARTVTQASSNYGIGSDGRIALYVDEANRSWASSNGANDHRAVTIEVASTSSPPYKVTEKALAALIDLCTDICRRNGIKKLVWSNSKADRVGHKNGCNMTCHRDFATKACPGDYLYALEGDIAAVVNKRLEANDEVTQEQFNAMADAYFAQLRSRPVSDWAKESWEKAKAAGVFDGTAPQGPLSRQEAAVVLERKGMI